MLTGVRVPVAVCAVRFRVSVDRVDVGKIRMADARDAGDAARLELFRRANRWGLNRWGLPTRAGAFHMTKGVGELFSKRPLFSNQTCHIVQVHAIREGLERRPARGRLVTELGYV